MGRAHNFASLDLGQGLFLQRHEFLRFFKCTFNDTKKNISSLWRMESLQVIHFPLCMKSAKGTMFTRGPRIFSQLKRTAQKGNVVFPSLLQRLHHCPPTVLTPSGGFPGCRSSTPAQLLSTRVPFPNKISCFVSTCVSSDNSFLSVRQDPPFQP